MSNIKLAVSFYSLQDQYARGKMKLEDIIRFVKEEVGAEMEFISDQMIKGVPHPSEDVLKEWDSLMNKYKIVPTCNNIYVNTCLYKNRTLTTKEGVTELIEQIKLSKRLGFKLVKLVSTTPVDVIEQALPFAEENGVTICIEIHGGMSFDIPDVNEFIKLIYKTNSSYLGLVVDAGIFCRRHPRVATNYFRSLGVNEDVIKYIDKIFEDGSDPKQFYRKHGGRPQELLDLCKNELDHMYTLFSDGYESSDFSILDEHMPYIKHFHAKTYEITDEGVEYSIPYEGLIKYLDEKNFDGYMAVEYEGNRFTLFDQEVKEVEQVKKCHKMLKKYIDDVGK